MTKVAVIAPHPDDETLGCGGTLLKHRASGDSISWIIISSKTKKYGFSMSEIKQREQEIKRVSQLYNFTKVINLNLPTMHLDQIPLKGLVESISTVITKVEPYTL
jgi:LmbE family N-acetylglucosaminyl deacetylase